MSTSDRAGIDASRALLWAAIPLLLIQCSGLDRSLLLSWPTVALVLLAALKLWFEDRKAADRRLVALLELLSVGLLAAQMPGLLASLLQLISTMVALAGLLALEWSAAGSLRQVLLRSLQLTAAALPLALVLFVFLPRLGPLWLIDQGAGGRASTGLSPDLDPLGISELVRSDAPAARVSFAAGQAPPLNPYWRVLIHEQFDGRRWRRIPPQRQQPSNRDVPTASADVNFQWWTIEPSRTQAVPWDGQSLPASAELKSLPLGELLLLQPPVQPRSYRLRAGKSAQPWQQRAPGRENLALPPSRDPRLQALAERWRALPTDRERLAAAEAWFRGQPFRYSLQPGALPAAGLDGFLFDRQVGFCGHYASAFAALMRSAGVPARVVSGYQGGQWVQPLSGPAYLDIRQSDAHAWTEVWLQGRGWQQVDPTSWASTIDATAAGTLVEAERGAGLNSWRWLQRQWWGLDFAWTQFWLGFDESSQRSLLERLFGPQQRWIGLMVVFASGLSVALGVVVFRWLQRGRSSDPLQLSLRLLHRLGIDPEPGESFPRLCQRAARMHPASADLLQQMARQQQRLAHAPLSRQERRSSRLSWRRLRRQLARKA